MADPITAGLAIASIGSTVLGGMKQAEGAGVQAQAAKLQGESQAGMYNYQAAIALLNKQIAEQEADYARKSGEVQAQQSDMQTRFKTGIAKTVQGASGLDVEGGSATAVRSSISEVGAENTAIIRSNAARVAYGYEVTATSQGAQAELYKMAGRNALIAGGLGVKAANIAGEASILGTAGSVSSKWLQGNQAGLWSPAKSPAITDSGWASY